MLSRLFPWRSSGGLDNSSMSRWAGESGWQFRRSDASDGWAVEGRLGGSVARVSLGPSQCAYIAGRELRAKVDVNVDATVGVMIVTRALLETLESLAFADLTDSLQTAMISGMPEEVRWAAMYGEHTVSMQGAFTTRFAVVGESRTKAAAWVGGLLEDRLLQAWDALLSDGRPLMIMLMKGRLYARVGADQLTQPQWRHLLALIDLASVRAREAFAI